MDRFDLDAFLPYRLAVTAGRVSRDFAREYRRFGLGRGEWRLLAHLGRARGAPVSVREVAEAADMEKSRVSRAAGRLERRGLVAKAANPSDRRLIDLTLSPEGRTLLDTLEPIASAYDRRLRDALGGDADALDRALSALARD